jgi:excisionase family DNA binding protein
METRLRKTVPWDPGEETPTPQLWTIQDVCVILRLKKSKVYQLMGSGELDYVFVARGVRLIPQEVVNRFLARRLSSNLRRVDSAGARRKARRAA